MFRERKHELERSWKANSWEAHHLCLNGGRSLGAQHLDSLEDVHHALVPHPLQNDAEGDEHTGPAHSGTVGPRGGNILRAGYIQHF